MGPLEAISVVFAENTFASLKKTCRKLGVGFWSYLSDRLSGHSLISWLPNLMRQRVIESPG